MQESDDLGQHVRLADQGVAWTKRPGAGQDIRPASAVNDGDFWMPLAGVATDSDAVPPARHVNVRDHGMEAVRTVGQQWVSTLISTTLR